MFPNQWKNNKGVNTKWIGAVFALLLLLFVIFKLSVNEGPWLGNDSFQYISVAAYFNQGEFAKTGVVYFDTERSHGFLPAPLTTFPFGYPLAIATVSHLGISHESAAVLISLLSLIALTFAFNWALSLLKISLPVCIFINILWVMNEGLIFYSASVGTEGLFTCLSFLAIVLLIKQMTSQERDTSSFGLLATAYLLIGVSYYIRYAGLILFAGVYSFQMIRFFLNRSQVNRDALVAGIFCVGLIAIGFIRNFLLVGDWRGGNNKGVDHSLIEMISQFIRAIYQLFFGFSYPAGFGRFEMMIGGATVLLIILLFSSRSTLAKNSNDFPLDIFCFLCFYIFVYCASLIYLGMTGPISFGVRLFIPFLPVLLLVLALILNTLIRKEQTLRVSLMGVAAMLLFSMGYAGIHARNLLVPGKIGNDAVVTDSLSATLIGEESSLIWIKKNIPKTAVLMANEGQALHYVLKNPVVALADSEYSVVSWNEETLKQYANQFNGEFCFLFKNNDPVFKESPFLSGLLAGKAPHWLSLIAHSKGMALYKIQKGTL